MSCKKLPRFFVRLLVPILILVGLASCAVMPKPLPEVKPGKEIETVQSLISVSFKNLRGSMGGRGYLIFKRPDRFHLAVLSPFGTTVMEVFVEGQRMTCVVPSKDAAYSGLLSELPDNHPLKSWSMMHWIVETPPTTTTANGGMVERVGAQGEKEVLSFDERGLLQLKKNHAGDEITYGDYREINGVAFPTAIELRGRTGDSIKVVFKEPDINQPVDEPALIPNLEGMTVLPITEFRGL